MGQRERAPRVGGHHPGRRPPTRHQRRATTARSRSARPSAPRRCVTTVASCSPATMGSPCSSDDGTVSAVADGGRRPGPAHERRQVRPVRSLLGREHRDGQGLRRRCAVPARRRPRCAADAGRRHRVQRARMESRRARRCTTSTASPAGSTPSASTRRSGTIAERRQFIDIPFEHGEPDGLTVDAAGCVWFAIWRAGEVRRYTPDGRLDTIVRVPATLSTSCCFGGRRLDTLFVTSAHCDLTPEQHADQPHAGSIFACRPGVDGLPSTPFAGPR